MKKAIITIISFFAIMCFSNNVYAAAATWAQASAGATVTVGSTTANAFSFAPSPGVLVSGASDLTVYCILTGNSKAAADALVYNVASGSGQVAQKSVDLTTSTTLGTPTTTGVLVTGFVTK